MTEQLSTHTHTHIYQHHNILLLRMRKSKPTKLSSVQLSCSVLSFCDPIDYSMPGFHDHHKLLEPTQTHVHLVGDAIQPSHPLLSSSPPAFNFPQHQDLYQWVSSSHQMANVLAIWSFSFSFSISPSNEYSGLISFRIDLFDLVVQHFYSLTFIKRLFSSSSLSAIRVVSTAYLWSLIIFLLAISACALSSLAFPMMCSEYKLNKLSDNIQPWCTPFPIWNQSIVPCPVVTVASWPACR